MNQLILNWLSFQAFILKTKKKSSAGITRINNLNHLQLEKSTILITLPLTNLVIYFMIYSIQKYYLLSFRILLDGPSMWPKREHDIPDFDTS